MTTVLTFERCASSKTEMSQTPSAPVLVSSLGRLKPCAFSEIINTSEFAVSTSHFGLTDGNRKVQTQMSESDIIRDEEMLRGRRGAHIAHMTSTSSENGARWRVALVFSRTTDNFGGFPLMGRADVTISRSSILSTRSESQWEGLRRE